MGCRAELLFYFPEACPDGQVYADEFDSLLALYDSLENPIWIEFLLERRHPLTESQNMVYLKANYLFAERWGIFQDSIRYGAEFNHDCCMALRQIVGDAFRYELAKMHELFVGLAARLVAAT